MKSLSSLLALFALAGCATQVATVHEKQADPNTIVLTAGQSAILSAGQTAKVPFGTAVREPGGGSLTLMGHDNTVTAHGGVIVSVPINAPGTSDNTVNAASVTLHEPHPTVQPRPAIPVPAPSTVAPAPTAPHEPDSHTRALMEGQARVLADRSWIGPYVMKTYGPVVDSLKIDPVTKTRLLDLLAERKRAVVDANQQFWKTVEAARRRDPTVKGPSNEAREAALRQAASKADGEIKALVDAGTDAKVQEMIAVESELSQIAGGYARDFAQEGCPLSADQRLGLASALHAELDPKVNPKAYLESKLPLNHSGLTASEEDVLKKLQGRLTPQQVLLVRKGFYFSERSARSLPIRWIRPSELPKDAAKVIGDADVRKNPEFSRVDVTLFGSGRARLKKVYRELNGGDDRVFCAVSYMAFPTDKTGASLLMAWQAVALFDGNGHFIENVPDGVAVWLEGPSKPIYPQPSAIGSETGGVLGPGRFQTGAVPVLHSTEPLPQMSATRLNPTVILTRTKVVRSADKGLRLKESRQYVQEAYGVVLDLLKLPPAAKAKLIDLLVERTEAIKDSEELGRAAGLNNADRRARLERAVAGPETQIRAMLNADAQAMVAEMIAAETWLSQLALNDEPELELVGAPLSAEQRLCLASAERDAFDPTANPKAGERSKLPLNSAGLTELDEEVLKRVEGVLSNDQRFHVQNAMVISNRHRK